MLKRTILFLPAVIFLFLPKYNKASENLVDIVSRNFNKMLIYFPQNIEAINEDQIQFDRETIIDAEGYWAASQDIESDHYNGKYPWPNANEEPWVSQKEFLNRLKIIESLVDYIQCRGYAPSRFEQSVGNYIKNKGSKVFSNNDGSYSVSVGSVTFIDKIYGIKWSEAFRSYYVDKFNVKPSREFYRYVMNYPLYEHLFNR